MNKIISFFILILTLSFFSCGKDSAIIPSYLYIEQVKVLTNTAIEGAPTENITDIWVYVNNFPIGAFDKQKLIPILPDESGNQEVLLIAGIRDNGIKENIQQYYLYDQINITAQLVPGQIDTIQAVFRYNPDVTFVFVEGFESGNIFNTDIDGDEKTKIAITNQNPRSGNRSGIIELNAEHPSIEVTSSIEYYNLPDKGNLTYLELDYYGNNEFIIGISGKDIEGNEYKSDFIVLKTKDDWNKIYLNLTKTIQDSGLKSYRIYFKAIFNNTKDSTNIFLDNIKLLYSQK